MDSNEDVEVVYKAVMYTDGSCLPPRGAHGGGCHGYLYDDTCHKRNGDKPNHYTITDNGYLEKHELDAASQDLTLGTGPAPVCPIELKPLLYYNAVYPYGPIGSSNRAELLAIISTIQIMSSELSVSDIAFYTDSMYVIRVYRGVKADLVRRAWMSDNRPNLDLWTMLANTLVENPNLGISISKVMAHGTAIGNNVADRLAYVAREMAAKGHTDPVFKFYKGKYWKDKPIPHPLLNFKQTYFNIGIIPNDENMYVIMDHPKDVELGNKSPEPIFGISIFKEAVAELDVITRTYLELSKGSQFLATIDLRVVHTQNHLKMVELLGTQAYDYGRRCVTLMGETLLVAPVSSPGLAKNAVSKTLELYKIYKDFLASDTIDDGVTLRVDITEQLYSINEKGKYTYSHGTNAVGPVVDYTLDGIDRELAMVYGKDTLSRNQLKRLEKDKPKVTLLLCRRSKKMFEYYTILQTDTADGIYGNYYINKIYV